MKVHLRTIFSVPTGPSASIEGPSPILVTEGSSLPICVVLNMPPTSTATVFISTLDRPSQTAVGEYKQKICVVHSNKCSSFTLSNYTCAKLSRR